MNTRILFHGCFPFVILGGFSQLLRCSSLNSTTPNPNLTLYCTITLSYLRLVFLGISVVGNPRRPSWRINSGNFLLLYKLSLWGYVRWLRKILNRQCDSTLWNWGFSDYEACQRASKREQALTSLALNAASCSENPIYSLNLCGPLPTDFFRDVLKHF